MTIDEAIKNLEYGIEQMTMELKATFYEEGVGQYEVYG